jgi:ADP-heptose:LPS heptosyltransferase
MTASRILVIKLGALGDFIQALGPMAAIRKHHPGAHVSLLTTKLFENFAKECGYFDEILIDKRPAPFDVKGWIDLRRTLNEGAYGRVYDLQNNDRSRLYFRLFKKKPEWVGTAKGASHRNTDHSRTAGHAFDGHVQTLKLAGIKDVRIDRLEWMQASTNAFPLKPPYVLLVPGCAPSRPEKRWPAAHYGRLAKLLHSLGYQPLVLGTRSEAEAAQDILKICPESIDLTNQTDFKQIAVLAGNAAGAIGNDTGPVHLIAATGCPSLILFSHASDPVRHAPKGEYVTIMRKENIAEISPEEVVQKFSPRQSSGLDNLTKH